MLKTTHEGEAIKDATFQLEEHCFRNCHLYDCFLIYDGGGFVLENTSLHNCRWKLRNAARNTFRLLEELGVLDPDGEQGPVSELLN